MLCCQERRSEYQLKNQIQELIIWKINKAKLRPNNCQLEIDLRGKPLNKNPSDIKFLQQQLKQFTKLFQLKKLTLVLQDCQIESCEKCIQFLCNLIKNLPKSLEYLDLQLDNNKLGNANNAFYLKQIFQHFKLLPQKLETFHLSLQNSAIMDFSIKFLQEDLKQMPQNIKNFRLDLNQNNLITFNIFKLLPDSLKNIEIYMRECNLGLKELDKDFFYGLPYGLQSLHLDLQNNYFGSYSPALQKLSKCITYLPQNLEKFTLNLNNNRLGKFSDDFRILAEGLQQLPKSINELELQMEDNLIGSNKQNVEVLFKIFKSIVQENQKSFCINLGSNKLGKHNEFRQNFPEIIGKLPKSIEKISLGLQDNDLGEDIENMKTLATLFEDMYQNVTCLEIDLSNNNLGDNEENAKFLGDALKGMMQFKQLVIIKIDLRDCELEKSTDYLNLICEGFKEVPKSLRSVQLKLNYNEILEKDVQKMYTFFHHNHIFYTVRDELQDYLPQEQIDRLS